MRSHISLWRLLLIQYWLERLDPSEHILVRAGALFGLYLFFIIQPSSGETLWDPVKSITLTIGAYRRPSC